MTRSSTLRLISLTAVGLVLGVGTFLVVRATNGESDHSDDVGLISTNPVYALETLDLAIRIDGTPVDTGTTYDFFGQERQIFRTTVAEVLWTSGDSDMPAVRAGDVLITAENAPASFGASAASSEVLLLAHSASEHHEAAPWNLLYVAGEDENGEFAVRGPRVGADSFARQVGETRAALQRSGDDALLGDSPLEFVFAWAEELHQFDRANPSGDLREAGPLTVAYRDRNVVDIHQLWNSTDPTMRSLDPEIVPADVLSTLEWTGLYLDFPAHAESDVFFVVVRNALGVMEATDGVVGTHPVQVLTPLDASWEVLITRDLSTMVGTVVARFTGPATTSDHVVITIDQSTIDAALDAPGAGEDLVADSHRFVDRAEYDSLLIELASADQ